MSRVWTYGGRGGSNNLGRGSSNNQGRGSSNTSTPGADISTPRARASTPRARASTPVARASTPGADTSTAEAGTSTAEAGTSTPGPSSSASASFADVADELESENIRGITNPEQLPTEKIKISLEKDNLTDATITTRMTQINKGMVKEAWCTWREIPNNVKDQMWERFQGFFCWDSVYDCRMFILWEAKSKKNYGEALHSARTRAGDLAVRKGRPYDENDLHRDMSLLKDFPPQWLTRRIWNDMIDRWNNLRWKEISQKNSCNRMTLVDGEISKHTGGSVPFSMHNYRLTQRNKGVPPTGAYLFDYTHKKRSRTNSCSSDSGSLGEYVTTKASNVAGSYQSNVIQKYGEDPTSHPIIDEELWKEATGGIKKGQLYGFGYSNDPILALTGVPSHGHAMGASSSNARIEALEARLLESEESRKKEIEEMQEARRKEIEEMRQAEEIRKKEFDEMKVLLKELSQNRLR